MAQRTWDRRYYAMKKREWIDRPSLFAMFALDYFPAVGRILELGSGVGRDSRFFAEHGYNVVSTDFSNPALKLNAAAIPDGLKFRLKIQKMDMTHDLPFADVSFDVVFAHLCIHYFGLAVTTRIVSEAARVLKGGGIFAFMVNSTSDSEYGQGRRIDDDFFLIGTVTKRYFSVESVKELASGFETLILDNLGEAHGKSEEGVHNMIRFIGRKKS